MTKYFYCSNHKKDEPMSVFGGVVGGDKYCVATIAAARKKRDFETRQARMKDNETEKQKTIRVQTARATSAQQAKDAERKAKLDQKKHDLEIAFINSEEFAF